MQPQQQQEQYNICLTKLSSVRGTPDTLVDNRSILFDGDKENLITSPRLIT